MPDISLLAELADFYDVSIPEIIDGERKSENMNREEKDTLLKVADYAENEKDILMKRVRIISCVGFGALLLALLFVPLCVPFVFSECSVLPEWVVLLSVSLRCVVVGISSEAASV